MSLLSVSSIQNPAAGQPNILLNADGSVTLPVVSGTAPAQTQAGTLWFDIAGPTLNIRNAANTAWLPVGGGGGGTVTGVTGTLPITVATGTTTPLIGINAATAAAPGSIEIATLAEAATGTDATRASTPETSVPKDAAGMTGAAILPSGTNAQRPATPAVGMTRINTTTNSPEAYVNGAWNTVQSSSLGSFAGFRNILINGSFMVNQYGYVSGTVATANVGQFISDRWFVPVGQSATLTASGNGQIITAPAGGITQTVEGASVAGGTYTLSWTGTATATVNGSPVANGGQVTLPANTNVVVTLSSGTVTNVQLEPGTVASPFEQRPYPVELNLCKRYMNRLSYGSLGWLISATQVEVDLNLSPSMYASPGIYAMSNPNVRYGPGGQQTMTFAGFVSSNVFNYASIWNTAGGLTTNAVGNVLGGDVIAYAEI